MSPYRRRVRAFATGLLLAFLAACGSMSPEAVRRLPSDTAAGDPPAAEPSDAAAPQSDAAPERAAGPSPGAGSAADAEQQISRPEQERIAPELQDLIVTGNRVARARPGRAGGSSAGTQARIAQFAAEPGPRDELPRPAGLDEEIWFIALPGADDGEQAVSDDGPGSGALLASLPSDEADAEPTTVPLPLEHTDVRAAIRGYVGTVDVTQAFRNPYDEKIEAVYMFPLPENAAVREFVMTIGERQIRGILREKEEAEQLYLEARAQGYRASLLVQHRPNVFEQKVANIEPGKRIDVNIRYFHTLPYHDGWYSFVFPAVVGPRYNPPGWQDPVAAVPRETIGEPRTGTAVRYLRPSERSAHDLGITVDLDAGVPIEAIEASHPIETVRKAAGTATVTLAADGTIPNRDFVLRFKVEGVTVKSSLLTYVDPQTEQGYFTLMVHPPADLRRMERRPVEMVFVLDTSGSMNGRPIEQAKEAVLTALGRLGRDDTFQIIRFSNDASLFGPEPVPATAENLREARAYVEGLEVGGGTQMIAGIRAALAFPHDEGRLRFVTFLTDGFIGNEVQILGEVHRLIGASRIFSFGVGDSVNRYLLERLASEGRGAVAYLGLDDSAEDVMRYFFERISRPALTDLSIDFGAMQASDVYPSRLPDLFVGRPIVVTGKFAGTPGSLTVQGRAGGESVAFVIGAEDSAPEQSFIASLWARLRIADLADRLTFTADPNGELVREIRDTALTHGLMSEYTAFVAVDASEQTAGAHGTTVYQAVPVPNGVRYETTVSDR